jgi:hypothetical protein
MTGQSLLDRMELFNPELQLQPGEEDVTRGLLALNVAQDYFESLAAARPRISGDSTGTVVTADSTETTAFPSGLLRVDRLQTLNASTQRPRRELVPLERTGGQAVNGTWPLNLIDTASGGEPRAYWTNGTSIYWSPLPDAVYTVRYYGLSAAADITAGGTFAYKDIVSIPLASFATRLLKIGLEDPTADLASLAQEAFKATLDSLQNFNRDGAKGLEYREVHIT